MRWGREGTRVGNVMKCNAGVPVASGTVLSVDVGLEYDLSIGHSDESRQCLLKFE